MSLKCWPSRLVVRQYVSKYLCFSRQVKDVQLLTLSLRSYALQRRLERSMWERFSVQSTPSGSPPPHSRNYSPAPPRRSSHLAPSQRSSLGLNFGGSSVSLGLSSNASNTSLPTTSRLPNGSSLRQEHYPATNVPDPLDVLRSILGIVEPAKTQGPEGSNNESRLVWPTGAEDIDFGSLSLQEYSTTNKDNTTFNDGRKGATFSSTRED